MTRRHIKPLTSMRFIFSLMVFLSHVTIFLDKSDVLGVRKFSAAFCHEGYLGVSFFFILSGFILSYTYNNKILLGKVSDRDFVTNRITRIYPLHILTLLISLPLVWANIDSVKSATIQLISLFANTALIQSFVPHRAVYFGFNSPSWSISNELFFYLITPLLFRFFAKGRTLFYLGFLTISTIFLVVCMSQVPENYQHSIFYINPIVRLLDYIVGIFLFKAFRRTHEIELTFGKSTLLEIASLSLFAVFFYFHDEVPKVYRYSVYYWAPMLVIIYAFAVSRGLFSRLLSAGWIVYLGEISFAFYMIHILVIKYFDLFYLRIDFSVSALTQAAIVLLISLLLSLMSFELFEKPVRRRLNEWFEG